MNDSSGAGTAEAWSRFVDCFFRPPNEIGPARGISELDDAIADAERLMTLEPPGPIILPARFSNTTSYFAIAFDSDQARLLRELLMSFLGLTWTDFEGRSMADRAGLDAVDAVALELAGNKAEYVFRLEVAQRLERKSAGK